MKPFSNVSPSSDNAELTLGISALSCSYDGYLTHIYSFDGSKFLFLFLYFITHKIIIEYWNYAFSENLREISWLLWRNEPSQIVHCLVIDCKYVAQFLRYKSLNWIDL